MDELHRSQRTTATAEWPRTVRYYALLMVDGDVAASESVATPSYSGLGYWSGYKNRGELNRRAVHLSKVVDWEASALYWR